MSLPPSVDEYFQKRNRIFLKLLTRRPQPWKLQTRRRTAEKTLSLEGLTVSKAQINRQENILFLCFRCKLSCCLFQVYFSNQTLPAEDPTLSRLTQIEGTAGVWIILLNKKSAESVLGSVVSKVFKITQCKLDDLHNGLHKIHNGPRKHPALLHCFLLQTNLFFFWVVIIYCQALLLPSWSLEAGRRGSFSQREVSLFFGTGLCKMDRRNFES